MLVPTICENCEKFFYGGPYSHFCPKCRKKRLSDAAKRRNLNKLGTDAYSEQRSTLNRMADNGIMNPTAHWIDNADSYLCSRCGYESSNPNNEQYGAYECPRCHSVMGIGENRKKGENQ